MRAAVVLSPLEEVDFDVGVAVLLAVAEERLDVLPFAVLAVLPAFPLFVDEPVEAAVCFAGFFVVEDVEAFGLVGDFFAVFLAVLEVDLEVDLEVAFFAACGVDSGVDFLVVFFVVVRVDVLLDFDAVLEVLDALDALEALEALEDLAPLAAAPVAAESGNLFVFFVEDFAEVEPLEDLEDFEDVEDLEVSALRVVPAVFFFFVSFFLANGYSVPGAVGGSGPGGV